MERQFSRTAHDVLLWFQAGLTHAWNDNFQGQFMSFLVSVSRDEFWLAVLIAFCFISVPINQFLHRCRGSVGRFHFYPQLSARKGRGTSPALCDLKLNSSGRRNLAEPHAWSFA